MWNMVYANIFVLYMTNLHLSLFHIWYIEYNKISINVLNLIERYAKSEKENLKYKIISNMIIYFYVDYCIIAENLWKLFPLFYGP